MTRDRSFTNCQPDICGHTVRMTPERVTTDAYGLITPWGEGDTVTDYGGGVLFYSTPSHGGFRLYFDAVIARGPAQFQRSSHGRANWYEEDCDAHLVVAFVPELFTPAERADSYTALAHWHPEAMRFLSEAANGALGLAMASPARNGG